MNQKIYDAREGSIVTIHMPMTPDNILVGVRPYYIVGIENGTDIARLAVRESLVGYAVQRYFFRNPLAQRERVLVGFNFTIKGADKSAHKKALSLAQKIADESCNVEVVDKSLEDIKKLFEFYDVRGYKKEEDMRNPIKDMFSCM